MGYSGESSDSTGTSLTADSAGSVNAADPSAGVSWNNSDTGWTVAKGQYQLYVGDSSRNLPLQAAISG